MITLSMTSTRPTDSASPQSSSKARQTFGYDEVASRPRQALRRPTKQASYELCNHAKAYLEGGQVASGYEFLYHLLAANTSISTPAQPYVGYLAPPSYIAFASSLIAYPKQTTQTFSREAKKGPEAALQYLRCVHTTIDGPAYTTIRTAFTFPEDRARRRGQTRRGAAASLSPEPGDDVDLIAGHAANLDSMWTRAEDFWHIVGWAFNCSLAHKNRWDRWKLWLDIMISFLETDWDFATKDVEHNKTDKEATLRNTLMWRYIAGSIDRTTRGSRRRIVRAILASGTTESLRDFPEVWINETASPKRREVKQEPLGKVDFEIGDTGDYNSDEEMQDQAESPNYKAESSSHHDNGLKSGVAGATNYLGGQDAINLRQRLLALLAKVAVELPLQFTVLADFFDNILEDFINLPTSIFEVLLSTSKMPDSFQLAFNANLLVPLVSIKIPDYIQLTPAQQHLEATLLPVKATTQGFAANAKVSLILEQVLMYMINHEPLVVNETLRKAMDAGINARHAVLGIGRGKKGYAKEEEEAKTIMYASSRRMRALLELLEMATMDPSSKSGSGRGSMPAILSFTSGSSLSPAPETDTETE